MPTNRLAKASSPYLRQHAHNPVNWFTWGEEAIETARRENKPILLSIGYAACHWCHVMAHESFEDVETANLMNELYVNIKVDREERPDLDKVYQTAHYMLTKQNGGWPLTVFLTPDLIPFFSGTYFPREARYQLPAFKELLTALAGIYQNQPDDISKQNAELLRILQHQAPDTGNVQLNLSPWENALTELKRTYDAENGGFGGAPKFPQTSKLELLLLNKSNMVRETLQHMAEGGIYDQLAGGFFRYTVDAQWQIPHFEKMLYDNAQLLDLYAKAANQFENTFFAEIARTTADWAIRTMQSSEGGFYASIDADSEGHEGKYYVWDKKEVAALLTTDEFAAVQTYYGLNEPPNFDNHWHLHVNQSAVDTAKKLNLTLSQFKVYLASAITKLLKAREQRIPPTIDKKHLTAWNSLMIKGLITAGESLKEPRFTQSAQSAIAFIQEKLWRNGRLLASYIDHKAELPAYLDDHAFLIDALLASLQSNWQTGQLLFAMQLADILLEYFFDSRSGAFFFTASDHEKLLYRPKTMMDEAIPAGNGIAVRILTILGYLLGNSRYLSAAEKTLQAAFPYLTKFPAEHCTLVLGLKEFLQPSQIIVIRSNREDSKLWQQACRNDHHLVFNIPSDEQDLPQALADKKPLEDKTCAYICEGMKCLQVVDSLDDFKNLLR